MDIGHTTEDIGIDALLIPVVEFRGEARADAIDPRHSAQPDALGLVMRPWNVANHVSRLINGRHLPLSLGFRI